MPPLRFILDTDMGTDVDDALALAFAIRHPDLELAAVTTVSGDTVRRALIARKLLRIAGRDGIEVAAGERGTQSDPRRSPENGLEDEYLGDTAGLDLPLSPRGGVQLLIDECRGDTEVAAVGMQSNIAAAVRRDASFAASVPRLTLMGGVFAPTPFLGRILPPTIDHNLNVDQDASLVALNAGIPALWVPGDVTMSAWLTAAHVDRLRKGDALCRELARQIDWWTPRQRTLGRGAVPDEYACLLHDPLAVACMIPDGRRFVRSYRSNVSVAMLRNHVRTFIDPLEGHPAEIVHALDAPAFADYWTEVVLG
jgi:purine nucleosidase